ncbi:MAG: ribonuclease P protein component [Candidatus Taylorbacteria bacterium]|nr:ribonuclease P protein component [Candidatus Taylorbacteria bacterium]
MLPKSKRLTTEAFKEIIEKGQSFHSPFLILKVCLSDNSSKFAISVPKKSAKLAVSRNKIRRQIYSIIKNLHIKSGYNVVVIVKSDISKLDFKNLSAEVEKIFVKSSLLK